MQDAQRTIKILAIYLLVFFAGFFLHAYIYSAPQSSHLNAVQDNSMPEKDSAPWQSSNSRSIEPKTTDSKAESIQQANKKTILSSLPAENVKNSVPVAAPIQQSAASTAAPQSPTSKPVSDAEIDAHLPAPFNNALKQIKGPLRDNYSKLLDNTEPASWEKEMYNHLYDGILSNPYSKFIQLESLQCRNGMCEILLYEKKQAVWSYIMAGMALQDWWKLGMLHSQGLSSGTPDSTAYYILISRDYTP